MTGTEPFKPFIERYDGGGIRLERVPGTEPAPGRTSTYRFTIYGNGWDDFWNAIEKCRLFYGDDKFQVSYATPMGMQDECPTYIMVEVSEPDVIPGHSMLRYMEIRKQMGE